MSPLVPVSKVSRIVAMPLDDDCDEKYIRPSRPFMFFSMIWVTEYSTTLADAPGYVARISTEGGATVGYIETGRVKIDSAPASMMIIAMTHVKMGRSMKKRAMGVSVTPARPARAWWWCLRWQPCSLRRRHARRHRWQGTEWRAGAGRRPFAQPRPWRRSRQCDGRARGWQNE